MYLKKLELFGFKSFAQKTVMDFPAGITAIIGPNGSGKSNVIDGLRWIMGEVSAKNIRADKAENLIFSGTLRRPRSSMAQVTIHFDNSTQFFPIDFNEVIIRRRVVRDGVSKYWINDSEVRLKDIVDLFSAAHLGTKFSVINQGSSDIFIQASPKERRQMVEEILGLRQYQIKRKDAQNKLVATKGNLEQVRSLIDELLPHLRLLRRQAKKWAKHGDLKQELEDLEENYFSNQLQRLSLKEKGLEPKNDDLEERITAVEKKLKKKEEALSKTEKDQPKEDEGFNEQRRRQQEILDEKSNLERRLARIEAELEFLSRDTGGGLNQARLAGLARKVKELVDKLSGLDFEGLKKIISELGQEAEEALGEKRKEDKNVSEELLSNKEKLLKEIAGLDKDLNELMGQAEKRESSMRGFHLEFKKAFSEVEEEKNNLMHLEREKNQIALDKERIKMRFEDLREQLTQAGRSEGEFKNFQSAKTIDERDLSSMEQRMLKLRGELASIGEIDEALLQEAKEMEERHTFLSQQVEDLERAVKDLEQLITQLKEKLHTEFSSSLKKVNEEFNKYFKIMFNGGRAHLNMIKVAKNDLEESEGGDLNDNNEGNENRAERDHLNRSDLKNEGGLDISLSIPRKNIRGLDMLSGGERSLVSIAVLFALVSVSPPPFLVLDEVDAALDESNTKRFASLIHEFSEHTQFMIVTHNRATMSEADVLYGVTMADDGTSKVLSLKLQEAEKIAE